MTLRLACSDKDVNRMTPADMQREIPLLRAEIERLQARLRDAVIYAEQFDGSDRLRAWARETRKLLNEQAAPAKDRG